MDLPFVNVLCTNKHTTQCRPSYRADGCCAGAFFCGPVLDTTAKWQSLLPGSGLAGLLTLSAITIGGGAAVFSVLEGWAPLKAAYFCVVTSTTIGYGDVTPVSPENKLAVVAYVLFSLNVMGAITGIAKDAILGLVTPAAKGKDSA